jgi:hypothetical protein
VIQTQLMKQRCVKVVHVDFVFDGIVPELVIGSMSVTGFKATASKPHRKTARIVIATGTIVFCIRCPTKLSSPPNDRVFQEPTLLKVS